MLTLYFPLYFPKNNSVHAEENNAKAACKSWALGPLCTERKQCGPKCSPGNVIIETEAKVNLRLIYDLLSLLSKVSKTRDHGRWPP